MDRINVLAREIEKHDKLYWEKGTPLISDIDYDKLVVELKQLDPGNKIITRIHSPVVSSTGKVRHLHKMLSLEKETSVPAAVVWCTKKARSPNERFVLEPKYDGCSIEKYSNVMATRGDGIVGENITNKLPICNVETGGQLVDPCNVDYIRGEILFKKEDFRIYNESVDGKYATPRNATGGILNKDDFDISVGRILTIIPFDEHQVSVQLTDITEARLEEYMNEVLAGEYPCDGIVIKLADVNYRESLGATSSHNRWEISLKFANPTGESVLRKIEWCMGKRKITPRAHIDPVEIGGVMVSHINLHNYKYLIDNDIHIGDTLIVERAGDVIPDFKSLIPGAVRIKPAIHSCPECGFEVEYVEPEMVCKSTACSGQHLMKLMDSVIRIGIERLGKPTLEKILETFEDVSDLVGIFNLEKEDALRLPGFADSSADNLIAEIEKARNNVTEWRVLASLNIQGIGTTLSKDLLSGRTLTELRSMTVGDFVSIKGIGQERAELLVAGLLAASQYIDLLIQTVVMVEHTPITVSDENARSICFTGKMPEKRSVYEKMASEHNMIPTSKVNKDLDILVVADTNSTSSKMKNAKKYGTQIINVEEFLSMIPV
ncbi:hypothetical protein KAR91_68350 [Candidatus Pacearchaeota archaeon]|nr:hypothetical protein [Candidatus Pacearchaeota archaeon]